MSQECSWVPKLSPYRLSCISLNSKTETTGQWSLCQPEKLNKRMNGLILNFLTCSQGLPKLLVLLLHSCDMRL